jgi:hypothetical protein
MQYSRRAVMRILTASVSRVIGVVLMSAMALASAESATALKILATDPAPDVLLARQQPFFVRFEIKSVAPVAVTVSGLYKGNAVNDDGGASAPAVLPANGGIGVVSFFYWGEKPTRIDEVRLKINDSESGAKLGEYAFPVALTWLADDPPPREPAAWVREWQQAQIALNRRAAPKAGAEQMTGAATWLAVGSGAVILAIAIAVVWWRQRRAHAAAADDKTFR